MFREILCTDFAEMAALVRCSYARCADSLCYNAHCSQVGSNLSQSHKITTHCTSEFASIHSISKTVRTSSDIAIVLEQGSPFDRRMLGIPELQALLQLFADKLFTGLKRLRTAPHLGPWKEVVYIIHLR